MAYLHIRVFMQCSKLVIHTGKVYLHWFRATEYNINLHDC